MCRTKKTREILRANKVVGKHLPFCTICQIGGSNMDPQISEGNFFDADLNSLRPALLVGSDRDPNGIRNHSFSSHESGAARRKRLPDLFHHRV